MPAANVTNVEPAAAQPAGRRWAMLVVLTAGAFATALNVTLLSPLLVQIAADVGVSVAVAGQLATVAAACAGVMAVAVAPLLDRYPRRFWLRLQCTILVLGTLLSALAPSFGWLFAGRALAGIGGAVIGATCLAACSDLFPDRAERNRAIAFVTCGFTLGAVFGLPFITLAAELAGWRWAIALLIPFALLVVAGASRLPRSVAAPTGGVWDAWRDGYRRVLGSQQTLWLLAAEIAFMFVWFSWIIYFGALAETVFGVGAALLSMLFLAGGVAELVGNNLAPILLRRRAARDIGAVTALLLAVNMLLVGVAYVGQSSLFVFFGFGSLVGAVLFIVLNVALLDSLPDGQGAVMSLQSASLEVGGAIGVAATGAALALLGDLVVVYRLLGLVMPLVVVFLFVAARRPSGSLEAGARPALGGADG